MPLKSQSSSQLLTLAQAKQVAARLEKVGVTVENIREIGPSGEVSLSDLNYYDDGSPHQYIAKVWGKRDMELGLIAVVLGERADLSVFVRIATDLFNDNPNNRFQTMAQAYGAILDLPLMRAAGNSLLGV